MNNIGDHSYITGLVTTDFYPDSKGGFSPPNKDVVQGVTKITNFYKVLKFDKFNNLSLTPYPLVTNIRYRGFIYKTQEYYFFNNIYFFPSSWKFGKISNEISSIGYVWSTYKIDNNLTLANAVTKDYSLVLKGDSLFRPMAMKEYTITAFKRGNLKFNENIEFNFDTDLLYLPVSGFRVQAIPYPPNRQFTETLKYKTSISSSMNNNEQRASLSKYPTRDFDYTYQIDSKYANSLTELFQDAQSSQFLSPVWHELTLPITKIVKGADKIYVNENFKISVDDSVFIYNNESDFEILEVKKIEKKDFKLVITLKSNVTKDYKQPLIIPAFACSIKSSIKYRTINTVNMIEMKATLTQDNVKIDSINHTPSYPIYDDLPVMEEFNASDDWSQKQNVYFYDTQPAPLDFLVISDQGRWSKSFKKECNSKAEYDKWCEFFNWCKGRWKAFWIKDEQQSFTLLKDYTTPTSEIDVAKYGQVVKGQVVRIAKSKFDKVNVIYTKVAYTAYENDILKISLEDVINFELIKGTAQINLLRKYRLASDDVKIDHSEYNHKTIEFMAQGLINDW